ncbi:hypothetical protein [Streptacidiphilus fuscans]|uniref:hypothetical protein n=1 Tax=Streptacidiphilus fuscans TaxID=2789292 RepID=UPI0018ACA065|nr:hypothetical protein [Streptacidiphilus fuscans]
MLHHPRWAPLRGGVLAVLLAVVAAACWAGFASSDAGTHAYLDAGVCRSTAGPTVDADCLVPGTATLRTTYTSTGKYASPHLVLTDVAAPFPVPSLAASGDLDVGLDTGSQLPGLVPRGGRVALLLWKGQVTRVTADGVSESTDAAKDFGTADVLLVLSLYAIAYFLVACCYAAPSRRGTDPQTEFTRRSALLRARLWPFSWILAAVGWAVLGTLGVVATVTPLVLAGGFAGAACLSALAVAVIRPGRPARPRRREAVHLPSATTPYE